MPPYTAGSRRSSTSRLTPLRTATCKAETLVGDQLVERGADFRLRALHAVDGLSRCFEQHEAHATVLRLLVALERRPRTLPVDVHRLGAKDLLHRRRVD